MHTNTVMLFDGQPIMFVENVYDDGGSQIEIFDYHFAKTGIALRLFLEEVKNETGVMLKCTGIEILDEDEIYKAVITWAYKRGPIVGNPFDPKDSEKDYLRKYMCRDASSILTKELAYSYICKGSMDRMFFGQIMERLGK